MIVRPTVQDVARRVDGQLSGLPTVAIDSITHDSRQVIDGAMFACVVGLNNDGHDYAGQAVEAGAGSLLVERPMNLSVPQVVVSDVRQALGPAASEVFGNPSQELSVVGVTGTSGKTSVTHMLGTVLNHASMRTTVHGTLSGARTTPEAPELQATLRADVEERAQVAALEVSSHALALGRVRGTRFALTAFTNLGHDHLDFHETTEKYREAKAMLFTPEYTSVAIINADDPAGEHILSGLHSDIEAIPFRLADAQNLSSDGPINRFDFRGHEIVLRLAGDHNVMNALVVALCAERLGVEAADIADGLCNVDAPRGRFEFVNIGQDFHVAVDYAHKPDALHAVLGAARQIADGKRVIVVFGCGGDRDKDKRPLMGSIAEADADVVIVTSDNPRSESPHVIIEEVLAGVSSRQEIVVEVDRREAIRRAVATATSGDVVLIAGKGHEVVQIIGDDEIDFDDRQVAIEALIASGRAT